MNTERLKQHDWLERLVGDWTYESESAEPGQPPVKHRGTERVRSLGGLWVVSEGRGDMPDGGTGTTMMMTLGYDPARERFVGTFIASVMTHLWVYEGELDAAESVLRLDTDGPGFERGSMAKYQDTIEFKSNDHRVLTSCFLSSDGRWHTFMTAHYRRTARAGA